MILRLFSSCNLSTPQIRLFCCSCWYTPLYRLFCSITLSTISLRVQAQAPSGLVRVRPESCSSPLLQKELCYFSSHPAKVRAEEALDWKRNSHASDVEVRHVLTQLFHLRFSGLTLNLRLASLLPWCSVFSFVISWTRCLWYLSRCQLILLILAHAQYESEAPNHPSLTEPHYLLLLYLRNYLRI